MRILQRISKQGAADNRDLTCRQIALQIIGRCQASFLAVEYDVRHDDIWLQPGNGGRIEWPSRPSDSVRRPEAAE